jgi:hypothetical protein
MILYFFNLDLFAILNFISEILKEFTLSLLYNATHILIERIHRILIAIHSSKMRLLIHGILGDHLVFASSVGLIAILMIHCLVATASSSDLSMNTLAGLMIIRLLHPASSSSHPLIICSSSHLGMLRTVILILRPLIIAANFTTVLGSA